MIVAPHYAPSQTSELLISPGTALAEHHDGRLELIYWRDSARREPEWNGLGPAAIDAQPRAA